VEEESVGEEIIEVEKSDVVDLSTNHDSWLPSSCLLVDYCRLFCCCLPVTR
jgi:hypothetical protein